MLAHQRPQMARMATVVDRGADNSAVVSREARIHRSRDYASQLDVMTPRPERPGYPFRDARALVFDGGIENQDAWHGSALPAALKDALQPTSVLSCALRPATAAGTRANHIWYMDTTHM